MLLDFIINRWKLVLFTLNLILHLISGNFVSALSKQTLVLVCEDIQIHYDTFSFYDWFHESNVSDRNTNEFLSRKLPTKS